MTEGLNFGYGTLAGMCNNERGNMTTLVLSCPLCGEKSWEPLWEDALISLERCSACRLEWVRPKDLQSTTATLFDADYFRRNYSPYAQAQKTFFTIELDRLRQESDLGSVLDVGFGAGAFLEVASAYCQDLYAVDISPFAYQEALRRFKQVHLVNAALAQAVLPESYFDLVTFWDVLANGPDPRKNLEKACALLKPGGALVIKTPLRPHKFFDAVQKFSAWTAALKRSLVQYPLRVFHFDPDGLIDVLKKLGFVSLDARLEREAVWVKPRWRQLALHPRGLIFYGVNRVLQARFPSQTLVIHARKKN